jgi:RNA polymerase sigma factor for flagellar operon FliA
VAAGVVGLADAAERFDPEAGNRFVTFAYYRIRGAMVDAIAAASPVRRSLYRSRRSPHISLEAFVGAGGEIAVDDDRIEETIDLGRAKQQLGAAITRLSDRQRRLLALHYVHGVRLDEIGRELGVSKSWASRIHAQALADLATAILA